MGYEFQSPGADAYGAIMRYVATQNALKRQQMIDEINRQNVQSEIESRQAQTQIAKGNADLNRKNVESEINNRQSVQDLNRAKEITENAGAQEVASPEAITLLNRTGMGGRVESRINSTPGVGVIDPENQPNAPGTGVLKEAPQNPELMVGVPENYIKPGFKYEQARAAAGERADLEKTKADERATAAREHEEFMAGQNNLTRAITQQNANTNRDRELREKSTADQKVADQKTKDEAARSDSYAWASGTLADLEKLITSDKDGKNAVLTPGGESLQGLSGVAAHFPGTSARDAQATLNQVKSRLAIDVMRAMKAQSRTGATGFGQLSDRELNVLMDAAGKFDTWQGSPQFAGSLKEVYDVVKKVMEHNAPKQGGDEPKAGTGTSGGAGVEVWTRDANGKLIKQVKQ